jgi:NADH-quinone oxidoreductase subunit F
MGVQPEGIFYNMLTVDEIPYLVQEHFLKGRPVKRLMYIPPLEEKPIPKMSEIDFFKKQRLIVLKNRGLIDPEKIDEYIARDGYKALPKALFSMRSEEIIQEIKDAGLRGRGGAGFPTGMKWEFCKKAPGDMKYIVCNADEGDPGAFMDRSILEADPHAVIEGMIIGAYAISDGGKVPVMGYIYVRNEYPLAVKRLNIAIQQAIDYGLLGNDILGSGFNFHIKVSRGAGAFVCGEETALMMSIQGHSGEPRQRPPFPAQKGLWDKPTNINNVKTWASVPHIINNGAKWFSSIGTETSKGTMIFSLVGKVNNTGLVEVPMGITLQELIFEIGGGIPQNKRFKAVQTGGPSGGCIPASLLKLPVDYERLTEVGSIMGSGGMIVMDEDTCMVDVAKYFITFTKDESCGKCTPCREGIRRMLEILTDITQGNGREGDIEILDEMGKTIIDSALCALGGTAPNPVLSTIRYFRDEYEAHIKYKRCPAYVCKKIISSPCQHACPLGTDVPSYVTLIAKGKFLEAIKLIRRTNPLPIICGRVCHHPCEEHCASGKTGDPIAIRALKRFVAEYELKSNGRAKIESPLIKYEKVAIIGSGPAGLMCGYYLRNLGYEVTIFEATDTPGGMLVLSIPEYRLPKKVLETEIETIKDLGIEIKTNCIVGKDVSIDDMFKQGFKAVFIAVGAHKDLKLGIPGEDVKGVINAVEFLKDVKSGKGVEIGDRVGVIGGGNVAMDAARTALRLGAKEVSIIYRRTRAEMPAIREEIEEAIKEGIKLQFLVAPNRVLSTNGKLTGIECVQMQLGDLDTSGRRRPIPIKGSEFVINLDTLIPAIGQEPDLSPLLNGVQLKVGRGNRLVVDPETLATDKPGIFAGGDVVTGPATVTQAMEAGKLAAESIHKYLRQEPLTREYQVTRPEVDVEPIKLSEDEVEKLSKTGRLEMPCIPVKERIGNFQQVELGYTEKDAITEAKRCLRCDRMI